MRTTVDLPGDLVKRAKIAAVQRGTSLREFIGQALERELAIQPPSRRRMTAPPVTLRNGTVVPALSNTDVAEMFQREDEQRLADVYRGR
jgi:hypothetical protein